MRKWSTRLSSFTPTTRPHCSPRLDNPSLDLVATPTYHWPIITRTPATDVPPAIYDHRMTPVTPHATGSTTGDRWGRDIVVM